MKTTNRMLLGLFFFVGQIIGTQTGDITGRVTDKGTGEGIPFANVIIEQDGVSKGGIATDFDGYFTFAEIDTGRYDISVSYVGYEKTVIAGIKVKEGERQELKIVLHGKSNVLDEVTVTESKIPLIKADETSSSRTITRIEIQNMPTRKINSLLENIVGSYQQDVGIPANYGDKKRRKTKMTNIDPYRNNPNFHTEAYDRIYDNKFINVKTEPLSTFSIDVDAASYSNVRRFLTNGSLPPKDAVRIEEMINYFNYDYLQPENEEPFSINTEISYCPWNPKNKLLHIGLQGDSLDARSRTASNLVFLIDVSGSMRSYNKLSLVKSSLAMLVDELRPEDRISMVVYAGAAGLVLPSTSGDKKAKIKSAINKLQSGGSTAGGAGIRLAYKVAKENFKKNGNNRVILATDGDFNIGASSDAEMVRLIEEKRKEGIFLTVLGFGMGNLKDSKMEKLADKGNGNYAYIDNIMEAKKVLVDEFQGTLYTIAKDVKLQLEFNPAKVHSYRLIGYVNRLLNKEDFNDDKKDAGELGAGHTVTALYELVLTDDAPKSKKGSRPQVDPLKYQQSVLNKKGGEGDEFLTIKFRYKKPKEIKSKLLVTVVKDQLGEFDEGSENLRFSTSVAAFGMLLRDSEFVGDFTYNDVFKLAKASKGHDRHGYRAEFLRLVTLAEKLDKRKTASK